MTLNPFAVITSEHAHANIWKQLKRMSQKLLFFNALINKFIFIYFNLSIFIFLIFVYRFSTWAEEYRYGVFALLIRWFKNYPFSIKFTPPLGCVCWTMFRIDKHRRRCLHSHQWTSETKQNVIVVEWSQGDCIDHM